MSGKRVHVESEAVVAEMENETAVSRMSMDL